MYAYTPLRVQKDGVSFLKKSALKYCLSCSTPWPEKCIGSDSPLIRPIIMIHNIAARDLIVPDSASCQMIDKLLAEAASTAGYCALRVGGLVLAPVLDIEQAFA